MKNLIIAATSALIILTGCGRDTEYIVQHPTLFGKFESSRCFHNKMASEGFGSPIYTKATIEFNSDGTGKTSFELFTDSGCSVSAMSGTADTKHRVLSRPGKSLVVEVIQFDGSSSLTMHMLLLVTDRGIVLDIDFSAGASGPYTSSPTSEEIATFNDGAGPSAVFFARK